MAEDSDKRVDEAWKEKVEQEREKGSHVRLPEPTLESLVSSLAMQALIGLGQIENPISKKREKDLEQAKFTIDTLQMLSEKTKGNVTPEEKQQLDGLLYDLRMRYVQASS